LRGVVASRAGDAARAEEFLRQARDEFDRIGARSDAIATDLSIAEAYVRAGRPRDALEILTALEATPGAAEQLGSQRQTLRGLALAYLGDRKGAREDLETALASAQDGGNDYEVALALGALEVLDAADARRAPLGDPARRAEAAEILGRLDIRMLPDYPPLRRDDDR
jgi:hypothetical protein